MPQSHSRKRARDQALLARWDGLPDAHFAEHGLSREAIKAAQLQLQGTIVLPGDADYDKDRALFDPLFDPHPIMIVYCAAISDVPIALGLARSHDSSFTVRSSGHCSAGFSGGDGVMIDVSQLDSIAVDSASLTVTVGPGCPFGNLHKTLAQYGFHVPGGECPDVCVAGYVQGGGYGFTSVTYGMSSDSVVSFQVILADGSLVMASQDTNYDLWWALRGGTGGTFGVVVSITYFLRPLGDCFGFALLWPLQSDQDFQNATAVMLLLQQDYMLQSRYAPNINLQVTFCFQNQIYPGQPPPPGTPLQPYFMIRGLYVGDPAAGAAAIAPLQAAAGCITQWTLVSSFPDLNDKLLSYPQPMPYIVGDTGPYFDKSSRYVTRNLSADEWMALLRYWVTSPVNGTYGYLEFYGGAINAYPRDQSAFIHRSSAFNAVMDTLWYDEAGGKIAKAFLDGWNDLIAPAWNGEVYQNYCSLSVPDYMSNYWLDAVFGLWAVKVKYDPGNFFAFAQVIASPMPNGPPLPPGGPGPVIVLPPMLSAALAQPIQYLMPAKRTP
jgi:hypothetical protein